MYTKILKAIESRKMRLKKQDVLSSLMTEPHLWHGAEQKKIAKAQQSEEKAADKASAADDSATIRKSRADAAAAKEKGTDDAEAAVDAKKQALIGESFRKLFEGHGTFVGTIIKNCMWQVFG